MSTELNQRGLHGTILTVTTGPEPRRFEGDRLAALVEVLDRLEQSLLILERRGVVFLSFINQANQHGLLPAWHVKLAGKEHWFHAAEDVDAFRQSEALRLGKDLVVGDTDDNEALKKDNTEMRLTVEEFHEIRGVNRQLLKLAEFGFQLADLVPYPRVAGREPPIRFTLEHDQSRTVLAHLRDLVSNVRRIGEKGLTITRFKGLGEMDAEELWETTLDPAKRILMQVTWDQAGGADSLFRKLMGEEVEERRNFIFEKGITVKDNIDYGS
jgi:DNA gyrase subunit B